MHSRCIHHARAYALSLFMNLQEACKGGRMELIYPQQLKSHALMRNSVQNLFLLFWLGLIVFIFSQIPVILLHSSLAFKNITGFFHTLFHAPHCSSLFSAFRISKYPLKLFTIHLNLNHFYGFLIYQPFA